ncbi:MAG: 2OG-Fe(II) oxygenase [Pseudomonadota bacterium]|nr:2OG-Fe(II) oxygenase [Pseudomonadota bacterium]
MATANEVAAALQAIGATPAFVSRRTLPAAGLALAVEGVGRIRFPISAATARRLCAVAQPAQHGYKEETCLDPRVRDTFEIDRQRITIEEEIWQPALQAQLERIGRDLGVPAGCRLRAELHNLLVYGPGQFFVGHQDSEKCDAMIATLVVGLPSAFSGGAMLIEHHDESVVVRGSASKLSFTAFYANCRHEVRPVTRGYRVVMTYNLRLEGEAQRPATPAAALNPLIECVRQYFASNTAPRWVGEGEGDVPDRLIYLLDHEYTRRGLTWQRLKGADGPRVAALQATVAALECGICLALADIHETWSCESELDGGRGSRRRRYREEWAEAEDEDNDNDNEPATTGDCELTDLVDSGAEIRHFVGADSKAVMMTNEIDPRELCYTKPSVEFDPFESEYEGYMGNYGNTVDRWYHRAAVVLWPRRRAFVMRAKVEPRWALGELSRTLKSQGTSAAAAQAEQLLPFWARAVEQADDNRVFARALAVAAQLDTPQLAAGLLSPFALPQFKASMAAHWLHCIERYGLSWSNARLAQWQPTPNASENQRLQWITSDLPELCQALHDAGSTDARSLADGLLTQEWRWTDERWQARSRIPAASSRDEALLALSKPLLALIDAATRIENATVRDGIFVALAATDGDVATQSTLALDFLRSAQAHPDAPLRVALASLREHWCLLLTALLDQAPRSEEDWSIRLPLFCNCKHCAELNGFLQDGQRTRYEWPLAEQHRKHVHHVIDSGELPLSHVTRRSGRPYVLVLQKTTALFARDKAQRRAWKQALDLLEQSASVN